MDAFFQRSSPSFGSWSHESLKNFRQISAPVQNHLKLVYLTLCGALAVSAVGVFLHITWNIGGFLTMLGCFLSIAALLALPLSEERKRFGLLMAASFFEGATIGPLVGMVMDFDPSILVTAFVGTSVAFTCFSGAAMLARRREFLYLGGLLGSGLSILFWIRFASSIFGTSVATFNIELFLGLLLFLGYVIFDTQEIIEKAHFGDLDYIKHALTLFTDFAAVLVRVLIIMLKNASDRSESKERKKRRQG